MITTNERFPSMAAVLEPKRPWRVGMLPLSGARRIPSAHLQLQDKSMTLTDPNISPIIALIAGILILILPRLLNYIVAIYLIIVGVEGLNHIHHFFR